MPPNFVKIQGGSEHHVQIVFNFALSFILSCLLKFNHKNGFHHAVFEILVLKAKTRVFVAGHVAMLISCVMQIIPTCSPMIERFFYVNWLQHQLI